jgi:hypothetical protein
MALQVAFLHSHPQWLDKSCLAVIECGGGSTNLYDLRKEPREHAYEHNGKTLPVDGSFFDDVVQ